MEYKEEINLTKIKNPIEEGSILFVDKNGKLKIGKIILPNENEKNKRILFSIEVSDAEEKI